MADDQQAEENNEQHEEQNQQNENEELGEAGKKALAEERAARKKAERDAKAATTELTKFREANQSEQEKALAAARKEGEQAAMAKANRRLLEAEVRAGAAGKLADPSDALGLLGDVEQFLDSDGDVDRKALAKAIDDLVKEKPYLAGTPQAGGSFDGGARTSPPAGQDMNQLLRQAAGR